MHPHTEGVRGQKHLESQPPLILKHEAYPDRYGLPVTKQDSWEQNNPTGNIRAAPVHKASGANPPTRRLRKEKGDVERRGERSEGVRRGVAGESRKQPSAADVA